MPAGGAKIQVTFPQVRVQVTMIQIKEQLKECLLLNPNLLTKCSVRLRGLYMVW